MYSNEYSFLQSISSCRNASDLTIKDLFIESQAKNVILISRGVYLYLANEFRPLFQNISLCARLTEECSEKSNHL